MEKYLLSFLIILSVASGCGEGWYANESWECRLCSELHETCDCHPQQGCVCHYPNEHINGRCQCPSGPTIENGLCDCSQNDLCPDANGCWFTEYLGATGCILCHDDCWECDGPNYNHCTQCWTGEPDHGVCENYLIDMLDDIENMSEDEIDAWIDELNFEDLEDLLGDSDFEDFLDILNWEEEQYFEDLDIELDNIGDLDDYEEEWDDFWKDMDDEDYDEEWALEGGENGDKQGGKGGKWSDKDENWEEIDDKEEDKGAWYDDKDDDSAKGGKGEDDDDDAGSSGDGQACGKACRIGIACGVGFVALAIIASVCYCYHKRKGGSSSGSEEPPSFGPTYAQQPAPVYDDVVKQNVYPADQTAESQPIGYVPQYAQPAGVVYPNIGQYAGQPGVQMQGIPVAQFSGQPGAAGIISPQVSPGNKQVD